MVLCLVQRLVYLRLSQLLPDRTVTELRCISKQKTLEETVVVICIWLLCKWVVDDSYSLFKDISELYEFRTITQVKVSLLTCLLFVTILYMFEIRYVKSCRSVGQVAR